MLKARRALQAKWLPMLRRCPSAHSAIRFKACRLLHADTASAYEPRKHEALDQQSDPL